MTLLKSQFKLQKMLPDINMYVAEAKTLFPHACSGLTIELRMAILKGYYGKIFPRSGLLRDHFVTSDS